jgi:hypothetical protein
MGWASDGQNSAERQTVYGWPSNWAAKNKGLDNKNQGCPSRLPCQMCGTRKTQRLLLDPKTACQDPKSRQAVRTCERGLWTRSPMRQAVKLQGTDFA